MIQQNPGKSEKFKMGSKILQILKFFKKIKEN